MELISLRNNRNNIEVKLSNFKELMKVSGKIVSIRVVSAYFDIDSLRQLLKYIKKNGHMNNENELIIIVDAYSSRCQSDKSARKKLLKLNTRIRKYCNTENSGIYLAKTGPLFHSKGYLVSTSKSGLFTIGSLNLTQKGILHNEELILKCRFKQGTRQKAALIANKFSEYVDSLIKEPCDLAIRIDLYDFKEITKPTSMREMFLSGRLYYEHKEQDPFRFNLKLPDGIKQSTSNISEFLETTTSSTIEIKKLISDLGISLPDIRQGKSMWKKFCVETCYGFWSPNGYYKRNNGEDCLHDQLQHKMKNRKEYYEKLYSLVDKYDDKLFGRLKYLVVEIERKAKEEGYEGINTWNLVKEKELRSAWKRWKEILSRKMEDEHFTARLFSGVASVVTPDIWEDKRATDEFETSFFDSILYSLRKSSKTTSNWPAYAIGESINGVEEMDVDKLRNKVRSAFAEGSLERLFEWN